MTNVSIAFLIISLSIANVTQIIPYRSKSLRFELLLNEFYFLLSGQLYRSFDGTSESLSSFNSLLLLLVSFEFFCP